MDTSLAVCDRCGWRDGPYPTVVGADAALGRHMMAEHADAARQQRRRAVTV